jgi:hypothetical protein
MTVVGTFATCRLQRVTSALGKPGRHLLRSSSSAAVCRSDLHLELKHQTERSENWMVVGWAGDDRIKLRVRLASARGLRPGRGGRPFRQRVELVRGERANIIQRE